MNSDDQIYRILQLHLDKQTIGFPETPSGSDISLLKQLFTPGQAEVTTFLTYKYEPLSAIQERAKEKGKTIEETQRLLDQTAARGLIGFRKKDGDKQYRNIPYLVGMLEGAFATTPPQSLPDLVAAHQQYAADGLFLRDFINTKVPQMRTIPIQKSITAKHQIGTYDEIRKIIEAAPEPIVIIECVCRKGAEKFGQPCKRTSRKETCMLFRDMAKTLAESGNVGRQITKDEALEIMRLNQEEGLILQPTNSREPEGICSCCGCCCGLLKLQKFIPDPVSHWATNFNAMVDSELCTGCGQCVERCNAGALKLDIDEQMIVVDLTRCLGCGLCIEACTLAALSLHKKPSEVVPPGTAEDMMEVIMSNKQ